MNKTPTPEQQAVIQAVASGKTLKIAALAGTGKTSTLLMIAQAYPKRRGLYLAYNTALKKEGLTKFPAWITCKTVHGLAYPAFGAAYHDQLSKKADLGQMLLTLGIEPLNANLLLKTGEPLSFSASEMLRLTRDVVRQFTYSDRETLTPQDVEAFITKELEEKIPSLKKGKTFYQENALAIEGFKDSLTERLLTYARALWTYQQSPTDDTIPAEHDTYLKLYQLSKPLIKGYDYIMLDEAQDANPCILDILLRQSCQVIYVGDKHQQIYAFRGTVNAMDKISGKALYLTQSFRFGNAIAQEANVILKALGSPSRLKGLPSLRSSLRMPNPPYTVLARTNLKLIEDCITKIEEGWKCCLLADTRSIVSLIRSTFYLWMKRPEWVRDERIIGFANWKAFVEVARQEDDSELLLALNFILKNLGDSLNFLRLLENSARYPEQKADIVFSTAHRAKGREWERVVLCDDFTLNNDHEMNLYYVALTRASRVLYHVFPTP